MTWFTDDVSINFDEEYKKVMLLSFRKLKTRAMMNDKTRQVKLGDGK